MSGKIKALLLWCQKNTTGYQDVNVVNMTTSWKDGLAFCALIHHYRPDLIDFNSLSKENIYENNQLAFQTAEKELGIAALLDADDMVSMKVPDKLSIITYVSQYYNCLHKLEPVMQSSISENTATKRSAMPDHGLPSEVKKTIISVKDSNIKKSFSVVQARENFSICAICKKRVHLVERFIEEGKVYHRLCHRTKSLNRMYGGSLKQYQDTISNTSTSSPDGTDNSEAETSNETACSSSSQPSRVRALANAFNNSVKQPEKANATNVFKQNSTVGRQQHNTTDSDCSARGKEISGSNNSLNVKKSSFNRNLVKENRTVDKSNGDVVASLNSDSKSNKSDVKEMLPSLLKSLSDAKQSQSSSHAQSTNHLQTDSKLAAATGNNNNMSEESSDDALPALSLSLTDSKQHQESKVVKRSTSIENNNNPFFEIAPLISELPMSSKTEPRSSTTGAGASAEVEPTATKRSVKPSTSPHQSTQKSNEGKPFGAKKTGKTETRTGVLNPFGDENSDGGNSEPQLVNPFEDDDDDNDRTKPSSNYQRFRSGTVNTVNSQDVRLNPFTDEYEEKKHPIVPPVPFSRSKTTKSKPAQSDSKTSFKASSHGLTKPAAPDWKLNVERKMQQMNQSNQTDQRFVEKATRESFKSPQGARNVPVKVPPRPSKKPSPKPSRVAPGFGFPLIKRKVRNQMTEEEITSEMEILDVQLKDLESKGVKLEEVLRDEMELGDCADSQNKMENDQLLGEWFDLVQEKNKLVRRETDLVYLMQQQRLEQEHADVEFQIRKLMNKPESEKTDVDREEESRLVEKLVQIVERRNTIIISIEEARVKEEEEDAAFIEVKSMHGDCSANADSLKKKKSKVKRIFNKKKKSSKPPKPGQSHPPTS